MTTMDPFVGKQLIACHPPKAADVICFEGAVRSSKTIVSLVMWGKFIRTGPAGNLLMVGKTIDTVIRNLLEPMVDMYGARRVTWNRGLGTASIFGRTVYIMGANDAKARSKIQGLTLVGAYVDEVANMLEDFFDMLRTRLSVPGAMLYMTCNPEGPKHWLLKNWLTRVRWWVQKDGTRVHNPGTEDHKGRPILNWFRVTFVLEDNVWLNRVNPGFVAELKRSLTGVFYRRNIESEWVSAEGMVYPEFDGGHDDGTYGRHVITLEQLPPIRQVLISALDYGTTHRTRGYILGLGDAVYDPNGTPHWMPTGPLPDTWTRQPALFVLAEFAPDDGTVGIHAAGYLNFLEANRGWGEPEWLAIDPAAATFKAELFARGRSDVMNAHNAVLPGIQTVAALFAVTRLFIVGPDEHGKGGCPKLIDALPGYMWDVKATERGKTEVVKENDDEADALRYAVYTSRRDWRDQIPLAPIDTPDEEDTA